jgi:hypothetical protein
MAMHGGAMRRPARCELIQDVTPAHAAARSVCSCMQTSYRLDAGTVAAPASQLLRIRRSEAQPRLVHTVGVAIAIRYCSYTATSQWTFCSSNC